MASRPKPKAPPGKAKAPAKNKVPSKVPAPKSKEPIPASGTAHVSASKLQTLLGGLGAAVSVPGSGVSVPGSGLSNVGAASHQADSAAPQLHIDTSHPTPSFHPSHPLQSPPADLERTIPMQSPYNEQYQQHSYQQQQHAYQQQFQHPLASPPSQQFQHPLTSPPSSNSLMSPVAANRAKMLGSNVFDSTPSIEPIRGRRGVGDKSVYGKHEANSTNVGPPAQGLPPTHPQQHSYQPYNNPPDNAYPQSYLQSPSNQLLSPTNDPYHVKVSHPPGGGSSISFTGANDHMLSQREQEARKRAEMKQVLDEQVRQKKEAQQLQQSQYGQQANMRTFQRAANGMLPPSQPQSQQFVQQSPSMHGYAGPQSYQPHYPPLDSLQPMQQQLQHPSHLTHPSEHVVAPLHVPGLPQEYFQQPQSAAYPQQLHSQQQQPPPFQHQQSYPGTVQTPPHMPGYGATPMNSAPQQYGQQHSMNSSASTPSVLAQNAGDNRSRNMSSSVFGGVSEQERRALARAAEKEELLKQIQEKERLKREQKEKEEALERQDNERIERERRELAARYGSKTLSPTHQHQQQVQQQQQQQQQQPPFNNSTAPPILAHNPYSVPPVQFSPAPHSHASAGQFPAQAHDTSYTQQPQQHIPTSPSHPYNERAHVPPMSPLSRGTSLMARIMDDSESDEDITALVNQKGKKRVSIEEDEPDSSPAKKGSKAAGKATTRERAAAAAARRAAAATSKPATSRSTKSTGRRAVADDNDEKQSRVPKAGRRQSSASVSRRQADNSDEESKEVSVSYGRQRSNVSSASVSRRRGSVSRSAAQSHLHSDGEEPELGPALDLYSPLADDSALDADAPTLKCQSAFIFPAKLGFPNITHTQNEHLEFERDELDKLMSSFAATQLNTDGGSTRSSASTGAKSHSHPSSAQSHTRSAHSKPTTAAGAAAVGIKATSAARDRPSKLPVSRNRGR